LTAKPDYERKRSVKFIITEEDHRFIESIVERFDPARSLERPASVSEEDWSTYLAPLRGDLRNELEEALIGQALKNAGVIEDVGHLPSGVWTLTRREGESRKSEAWDRAYARVTEGWTSFKEEDAFLASTVEDIHQAREVALREAV
jgi:hypothetical protein